MARITVVATEHPVPLPDGRFVRTAAEEPGGLELEADLFVRRRLEAGELVALEASSSHDELLAPAEAADLVPMKVAEQKPAKPAAKPAKEA